MLGLNRNNYYYQYAIVVPQHKTKFMPVFQCKVYAILPDKNHAIISMHNACQFFHAKFIPQEFN